MNIGVFLPDSDLCDNNLERLLHLTQYYFKEKVTFTYFCNILFINNYVNFRESVHGVKADPVCSDEKAFTNTNKIIIVRDLNNNNPTFSWNLPNITIYKDEFFAYGGLRYISGPLDKRSSYIFENTSNHEYTLFPYTFLFKRNYFNDENELGFRIKENLNSLKNRPKTHKVIAIFGGSTVYDIHSLNSFPNILETTINNHSNHKYTVLNFGLCGGVLLNQIMIYMTFCWDIDPDIVISYDGGNDFYMGQFADTKLLKTHQINYNPIYEQWASNFDKSITPSKTIQTPSDIVIKAYNNRKKEFNELISSRKRIFISILQPTIFSKSSIAFMEKKYLNFHKGTNKIAINNLKILYQKYKEYNLKFQYHLDMDEEFNKYTEENTLFSDTLHTLPEGSAIIANKIYQFLLNKELI